MSERPKRKGIPQRIKKLVCERQSGICGCGCGRLVEYEKHAKTTRFDHFPALFLRLVNDEGTDYIPPQIDPDYIVARCLESDGLKTYGGKRATTAGSDANANAKQRRREKAPKPKRPIASRKMGKGQRFAKGHRPMRWKPMG